MKTFLSSVFFVAAMGFGAQEARADLMPVPDPLPPSEQATVNHMRDFRACVSRAVKEQGTNAVMTGKACPMPGQEDMKVFAEMQSKYGAAATQKLISIHRDPKASP